MRLEGALRGLNACPGEPALTVNDRDLQDRSGGEFVLGG